LALIGKQFGKAKNMMW